MPTKAKRHTHKYHRVELDSGVVWACGLPTCNHHMPEHMTKLILGKASICWGCSQQFVMDSEHMKEERPTCFECKAGTSIKIKSAEVLELESEARIRRLHEMLAESNLADEVEIIHPTESTDEIETVGELVEVAKQESK